jgi:hypothetical protein
MFARFATTTSIFVALAYAGCSSGSGAGAAPTDCHANPTQCPVGDTCWPISETALGCIPNQASAVFGSSCVEKFNQPTCADGLLCDAMSADGIGTCASYCSDVAPCPTGYACRQTTVGTGSTVDICRAAVATTPSGDGGTEILPDGGGPSDGEFVIDFDATPGPDSMAAMQ